MEKSTLSKKMIWIFGYGSLIWKPNFHFQRCENSFLRGWTRRFLQGSPDHRGTAELPGCVVTILEDETDRCYGRAYQISMSEYERVFAYLDHRECEGYQRLQLPVQLPESQVMAYVYIATEENPHFLKEWTLQDIAKRIAVAQGPSGSNREYFRKLRAGLQEFAPPDPHIESIEILLNQIG